VGERTSHIEITSLSAINHILTNKPSSIIELHLPRNSNNQRLRSLYELAIKNSVKCSFPSNSSPSAILKKFQYGKLEDFNFSHPISTLIALDHLQDPQNFGAICRTAEALGCHGILIPKDRSVPVSSGVYAASAGAIETIPIIQVSNLYSALKIFKESNYWVIGSTLNDDATVLWELQDYKKIVLVLGSEHDGIGKTVIKICDVLVNIPISGKIQSLNVSAAAAILIYELYRKNRLN